MLILPSGSQSTCNILGIDPGSTNLGIAVLEIDVVSTTIISSAAWTINGDKLVSKDSWIEEIHNGRTNRILAIGNNLSKILNHYRPIAVCSESPFINSRFPLSGIALTEVLCMIRATVMKYDMWRDLILIPPSSVKNAVGAGGAAKKEVMRDKVMGLSDLNYNGHIAIHLLDEHSIDALAVAYTHLNRIKNNTV